jgi:ribosomal protein S12 methylthiotransferase accessory factor
VAGKGVDTVTAYPYRDAPPRETITRIRAILDDLGLCMHETEWHDVDRRAYSLSIAESGFSLPRRQRAFGANGKGTSVELALASAYAEFLERLQNLHPTCFFGSYGQMPERVEPPDIAWQKLGDLFGRSPACVNHLFAEEASAALASEILPCLPFYSLQDDRVEWISELALAATCESNGMCAGNTAEEALVHGLSEVCERYVAREAFRHRLEMPTIPASQLEQLSGYRILRAVEAAGYRVIVKDGSLGGRYPVLGAILIDPQRRSYHLHYGASPSLDIALQRCLTEAFQGVSLEGNTRLKPLVWDDAAFGFLPESNRKPLLRERVAWRDFVGDGTGEVPTALLVSKGTPRHQEAFESSFRSTRSSLHFLLRSLNRSGHPLFVRDVAWLGFPAFRIYAPGMSEIHEPLDEARFELFARRLPRARAALLSLKTASEADLRTCTKTIEDVLLDTRFPSWSLIPRICQVVVTPEADFAQLYDAKLLLALLHHRLGDDRESADAFRRWLFDSGAGGNADARPSTKFEYGAEALAFHALKASGRDDAAVRETLAALFGEERAGEAVAEFLRHEQVFRRFSLPQCGCCEVCEAVSDCQYPAWRALAERVRDKLLGRRIDQAALRSVLQIQP